MEKKMTNNETTPNIPIGPYQHSKTGNYYEVIGTALHTETKELLVIYRPIYDCEYQLFARPVRMFFELVEINGVAVPRFVSLDQKSVDT